MGYTSFLLLPGHLFITLGNKALSAGFLAGHDEAARCAGGPFFRKGLAAKKWNWTYRSQYQEDTGQGLRPKEPARKS
jgi:hypothetical protein